MRHSILANALAVAGRTFFAIFLAGSLHAQLAQPPAGVTEGAFYGGDESLLGESRTRQSRRHTLLVRMGRSGQRTFSNEGCLGLDPGRRTQVEAQVGLWSSRRREHVFAALGGIRQSFCGQ